MKPQMCDCCGKDHVVTLKRTTTSLRDAAIEGEKAWFQIFQDLKTEMAGLKEEMKNLRKMIEGDIDV